MNGIRQGLYFVIKNGFYLPSLYAGEPLKKLLRRGPIFEIFEKRRYRSPSATEYPDPADLFRIALNRCARFPVYHLLTPCSRGLAKRRPIKTHEKHSVADRYKQEGYAWRWVY